MVQQTVHFIGILFLHFATTARCYVFVQKQAGALPKVPPTLTTILTCESSSVCDEEPGWTKDERHKKSTCATAGCQKENCCMKTCGSMEGVESFSCAANTGGTPGTNINEQLNEEVSSSEFTSVESLWTQCCMKTCDTSVGSDFDCEDLGQGSKLISNAADKKCGSYGEKCTVHECCTYTSSILTCESDTFSACNSSEGWVPDDRHKKSPCAWKGEGFEGEGCKADNCCKKTCESIADASSQDCGSNGTPKLEAEGLEVSASSFYGSFTEEDFWAACCMKTCDSADAEYSCSSELGDGWQKDPDRGDIQCGGAGANDRCTANQCCTDRDLIP